MDGGNLGAAVEKETTLGQSFQSLLGTVVLLQDLMQEPTLQCVEATMMELHRKLTSDACNVEQSHWIVRQEGIQQEQVLLSLNT